jgi:hypothetical protein
MSCELFTASIDELPEMFRSRQQSAAISNYYIPVSMEWYLKGL